MEILNEFGFEPTLFVAQIVNFLIIAYVFKRFLYKPLLNVIKKREEKIKKGIEDAEKANLLAEQAQKDREKILKQTRIESEKIIDDAKEIADEQKIKIIESAREESQKIINEAKIQASLEMEKMAKNINIMSLNLSQKIMDGIITGLFTGSEKEEIQKRAIKKLEESINQ